MKHAKEYIETYLNEFNSIKTHDIIAFINLFNKNIQNFNGKLYKYFSFEDNFSLSNLEGVLK